MADSESELEAFFSADFSSSNYGAVREKRLLTNYSADVSHNEAPNLLSCQQKKRRHSTLYI